MMQLQKVVIIALACLSTIFVPLGGLLIQQPPGSYYIDEFGISQARTALIASKAFDIQPVIKASDPPANATFISAVIHNNPKCSLLLGSSRAIITDGLATFTDLAIPDPVRGLTVRFCLGPCSGSLRPDDAISDPFDILYGDLLLLSAPPDARIGEPFPVQPIVRAARWLPGGGWVTGTDFPHGITAYLAPPVIALRGTRTVWPVGGVAVFTDLRVDSLGFAGGRGVRLVFGPCTADPAITRLSLSPCELAPAPDRAGAMAAQSGLFSIRTGPPVTLAVALEPPAVYPGIPLGVSAAGAALPPPTVYLRDRAGNVATHDAPWAACVRLRDGAAGGAELALLGGTAVAFSGGVAEFRAAFALRFGAAPVLAYAAAPGAPPAAACAGPPALTATGRPLAPTVLSGRGVAAPRVESGGKAGATVRATGGGALAATVVDAFNNTLDSLACPGGAGGACEGYQIRVAIAGLEPGTLSAAAEATIAALTLATPAGGCAAHAAGCLYHNCSIGLADGVQRCQARRSVPAPLAGGVAVFTDVSLRVAGRYRLLFYAQGLVATTPAFVVTSAAASVVETVASPGASPCAQDPRRSYAPNATDPALRAAVARCAESPSCRWSDARCYYGGPLSPQPAFRLWDRFGNLVLDATASVITLLPPAGLAMPVSLFCAGGAAGCECEGLECTVASDGGWVNLTGLSLDAFGAGYRLRAEAVVGSEALGDLCTVCGTTPLFDAFAPSAVRYLRIVNASRAGCRMRPSAVLQVMGYSEDLVLRPVPVPGLAFAGLMPCQDAAPSGCSAGRIRGSPEISFSGGEVDFGDAWIEGSGRFVVRFVVRMAGSNRALDPPFPDMQVSVTNAIAGLRIMQQPSACEPGSLLQMPARVMIVSAFNSVGGGWVCYFNRCSNSKERANLTAVVMHKSTGREVNFPQQTLVFINSTTAEMNFFVSIDVTRLFVRFIMVYPSCSEQYFSTFVIDTVTFSVSGNVPVFIRFIGPALTVHNVTIPVTITVAAEDMNSMPVFCPITVDFYLVPTSVYDRLNSGQTVKQIINECMLLAVTNAFWCEFLGRKSTVNSLSLLTAVIPRTGTNCVLVFNADYQIQGLSNISAPKAGIAASSSAVSWPEQAIVQTESFLPTTTNTEATQRQNMITNVTESLEVSSLVWLNSSQNLTTSRMRSVMLNSTRVFQAGERVIPPLELEFIDGSGNRILKSSGPWFVSYKYDIAQAPLCARFICNSEIVCFDARNQNSWCGPELKFTVNNTVLLDISAPLKAGLYHSILLSLRNWDTAYICQFKGELFTFSLSSDPFIVLPGKLDKLKFVHFFADAVAGENSIYFVKAVDRFDNEIEQGTMVVMYVPWAAYLDAKSTNTLDKITPASLTGNVSANISKFGGFNNSQEVAHKAEIHVNITVASSFALRISYRSEDSMDFESASPILWSDELSVSASKPGRLFLSGITDSVKAGEYVNMDVKVEDEFGNFASQFSQFSRLEVYVQGIDGLYWNQSVSILNGIAVLQVPIPSKAGPLISFNVILIENGISGTTRLTKITSSEKLVVEVSEQPMNSWVPGLISIQPQILVRDVYSNIPDFDVFIVATLIGCSQSESNSKICADECKTCLSHKNFSFTDYNCPGPCVMLQNGTASFVDLYITHMPQPPSETRSFVLRLSAAKLDRSDSTEYSVLAYKQTIPFQLQELSSLQIDIQPTLMTFEDISMEPPSVKLICNSNYVCDTATYPSIRMSVCLQGSSRLSQNSITSVPVLDGVAYFTELVPVFPARGVYLRFFLSDPLLTIDSALFDVKASNYTVLTIRNSCLNPGCNVRAGSVVSIQIDVRGISMKMISRNCIISLTFAEDCLACKSVSLQGSKSVLSENGTAKFNDLYILPGNAGRFQFRAVALPYCISDELQFSIIVINSEVQALSFVQQPGNGINNFPVSIQPILRIFDKYGNAAEYINQLLQISYNAQFIEGQESDCMNQTIVFSNSAPGISMGVITFLDVTVAQNQEARGHCPTAMSLSISINNLSIASRPIEIRDFVTLQMLTNVSDRAFAAGTSFGVSTRMTDNNSYLAESNIHWVRVEVLNCRATIDGSSVFKADGGYFNFSLNLNAAACFGAADTFIPEWCQNCNLLLIISPYSPASSIPMNDFYNSGQLQSKSVSNISVTIFGSFTVLPGPVNEMAFEVQPKGSRCDGSFLEDPVIRLRNQQGTLSSDVDLLFVELIQGLYLGKSTNASFRTAAGLLSGIVRRSSQKLSVLNGIEIDHPGDSYQICVTRCPLSYTVYKIGRKTCCKLANLTELEYSWSCNPYGPVFGTVCSDAFSIYNVRPTIGSAILLRKKTGPVIAGESLGISIRLLDDFGLAQASISYSIQAILFDSSGLNQTAQLVGQYRQNSIATFKTDQAGSIDFTDLSIRCTGISFVLDFEIQPISNTHLPLACKILPNISKISKLLSVMSESKEILRFDVIHGPAHHLDIINQPSPSIQARTRITGIGGEISVKIVDKFGNDVSCFPAQYKSAPASSLCDLQNNVDSNPIEWNIFLNPYCLKIAAHDPCSACESNRLLLVGTSSFRGAGIAVFNNISIFTSRMGYGARFNFTASFHSKNSSLSYLDFSMSIMSSSFDIILSTVGSGGQKPVKMLVLQQPSRTKNFAGFPFTMQPIISLIDEFGEVISSDWTFVITASLCKICTCPCTLQTKVAESTSNCSSVSKEKLIPSSESSSGFFLVQECSQATSALDGNVAIFQGGLFRFPGLTIFTAQRNTVLMFNTSVINSKSLISNLINFTQTIEIQSCSPRTISLSDETPFLGVADTGGSLCAGGTCAVHFDDAFGNAADANLLVFASLSSATNAELAGFGVPAKCRCTGVRNATVSGAVLAYGTRCFPWDKDEQTCGSLWPTCVVGIECCKSWCFVDSSACPDSIEHPSFPGMFVSFSACSDDESVLMRCSWQTPGTCNRYSQETKHQQKNKADLFGTTIVLSESGKAFFTDLIIKDPGVYILTFTAKYSNKILRYSSKAFGVTPLAARRMLVLRDPQGSLSTSNGTRTVNLLYQPAIQLIDRYENTLMYDQMCLSITASINSKNGRIFGQSVSDKKDYYLEDTGDYIITANAVNGIATFTALTVEPRLTFVVNFTTGCCRAQPDDCFCSNPVNPFVKDYASVLEPCTWAAAEVRILGSVESLFISDLFSINLTADDTIQATINLMSNGTILRNSIEEYHVSVSTEGVDVDDFIILNGLTTIRAQNGVINFTDLRITNLNGNSQMSLRLFFFVVEHPDIAIRSETFTISAGAPQSLDLRSTAKVLTVNDGIQAHVVFVDKYSNPSSQPGLYVRIELATSILSIGAANVSNPLVGNTIGISNSSGVYFGYSHNTKVRIIVAGVHTIRFISGRSSADLNLTITPGDPVFASPDWIAGTEQLSEICAWEPLRASFQVLDSEKNAISPGDKWILNIEVLSASLSSTLIGMLKCTAEVRGIDFNFGSDLCAVYTLSPYSTGEVATGTLKLFDVAWSFLIPRAQKSIRIFVQPPALNLILDVCVTKSRLPENFKLMCGSNAQIFPDCAGCDGKDPNRCSCTFQTANELFVFIPQIRLLHADGSHASGSTLPVSVRVVEPSCSKLVGNTTQFSVNGTAIFANLGISRVDINCQESNVALLFTASHLSSGSSDYFTIQPTDYTWFINLNPAVARLEFELSDGQPTDLAIPDVVAGMPFVPLTTLSLRCANCSEERVLTSSRTVKAIMEYAGGGLVPPEVFSGMTQVDVRTGYAVFTDLIFHRTGSYIVKFLAVSSRFTAHSLTSNVFKVRPADAYVLRITGQPALFGRAGEPFDAKVELFDIFNNTKSDDSNSTIVSQIYSNQDMEFDCTKYTALDCGCIGSVSTSILEYGVAEFKCLTVGRVGGNFTVSFRVDNFQAMSRQFSVAPGSLYQIRILQQPSQFKAGNTSSPIIIQFQDKCGNSISDPAYDTWVGVDVIPFSAGLIGTRMVKSANGKAIFTDLSFTRANSDGYRKDTGYNLGFQIKDLVIVSEPFWVTNAEIFAFQILDQPADILQGKSMKPFPKLVLTDTYGNIAVSSSSSGRSIVIASLTQDNQQQSPSCPAVCDGSVINGRCYKFFPIKSAWVEGRGLCETWGGKLARIWSEEEIQVATDLTGDAKSWIGLRYAQYGLSIDWSWDEDGERLDAQSKDWISEKLIQNNVGSRNCIALGSKSDVMIFSAAECNTLLPVICSKSLPDVANNVKKCQHCHPILGTDRVAPENGIAIFTDIQLFSNPGSSYRLHFVLELFRPTTVGKYLSVDQGIYTKSMEFSFLQGTVISQAFVINPRVSGISILTQPGVCTNAQAFGNQPSLLLFDFLGRKVPIDGIMASVKLSTLSQTATLGGNKSAFSQQGLITFTDLFIYFPSPLQESFALEFDAFDDGDTFVVFSSSFTVSPGAAELLLLNQGTCDGFSKFPCVIGAGDFVDLKMQMLDQYNELVEQCSAAVLVKILGTSENALIGERRVRCNKGIISFTNLRVVKASDQVSLTFSIERLEINLHTPNFSVREGSLTNLTFFVQPASAVAGNVLPDVVISTTDAWGNIVANSGTAIFLRLGDTCVTNANSSKNITSMGFAIFSNILLQKSGKFYLNARFLEPCDSLELLSPPPLRYLQATVVSSMFEIFPSFAADISVIKSINRENVAGDNFLIQPACMVRDRFGNNVSVPYEVKLRVFDRFGDGCVCRSSSESGQLCSPTLRPSVLRSGVNLADQEEDPSVPTIGGLAQFNDLQCTRASCGTKAEDSSSKCSPYTFSCEIVRSDYCQDCKALGNPFTIIPSEVKKLVVKKIDASVSGRSGMKDETSGFYKRMFMATNNSLVGAQMLSDPPSFILVDQFGNVNESVYGIASVRISPRVNISGYSFCTASSSNEGTRCLGGHTTVQIKNGTAIFTDLTILHSGPGFQLTFRFQGVEQDSEPFNVFPPPPKASGISIGSDLSDYSSLLIHFDQAIFTVSQEVSDCSSIFMNASDLLGFAPRCHLLDSFTLMLELGESFSLQVGDSLTLKRDMPIFTSEFWDFNQYTRMYKQVSSPRLLSTHGLTLNSLTVQTTCLQVTLPLKFQLEKQLSVEESVSVSDIEFFSINGVNYFFVVYYCKGEFCLIDPSSAFSAKLDLESPVYRWLEGEVEFVHGIPTQAAKDARAFSLVDSGETGPSMMMQFLVVANFRSDVAVWCWDNETSKFALRQKISSTFVTSVDVITYDSITFLVIANTDPYDVITVSNWISGEYNLDQRGTMSWVAGHFGQFIQVIPTNIVSRCMLYRIPSNDELYLGIASFQGSGGVGSSNQVPLELMIWKNQGCNNSIGCFETLLSIPAIGASTFEPFSFGEARIQQNYLAVANYFEGQKTYPVNTNYEQMSYIYRINYTARTYILFQTVRTFGLWSILSFKIENELFLALGNQIGLSGLNVPVRIYRFMPHSSTCTALNSIDGDYHFEHFADISARGPVALKNILRGSSSWLVVAEGSGLSAASFYQILGPTSAAPQPRPIISAPRVIGSCVPIIFDARSSMNSAGSMFTVKWAVESFTPAYELLDIIDNTSLILENINTKLMVGNFNQSYDWLELRVPTQSNACVGADLTGKCFDNFFVPNGVYKISLQLTNWLGASNFGTSTLVKAEHTPRLFIHGPSSIKARRAFDLQIRAEVEPYCPEILLADLEIKWAISPYVDVSWGQGTTVVIPSFTLKVETTYIVNVSMYTSNGLPADYFLTIVVKKQNPIANILGGDRLIGFTDENVLLLDASRSFDADSLDQSSILVFSWICTQRRYVDSIDLGYYPFPCESLLINSNQSTESVMRVDQQKLLKRMTLTSKIENVPIFTAGCSSSSEPTLYPPLGLVLCDFRSTFAFKVTACLNQSNLLSCKECCGSAEVVWSTTPASVPLVLVESLQEKKISGSLDTAFRGSISSKSTAPVFTRWVHMIWNGIDYIPLDLNPEFVASESSSTNMIIRAGYFKEARDYIFRLYATHESQNDLEDPSLCSRCGWAQVTVTLNSRPKNGRFLVYPNSGIAYQTSFELTAQEWYDATVSEEVYPLYYTFGYKEANGAVHHIAIDSIQSSLNTLLPDGSYPCQKCAQLVSCSCLQLTLQVRDSLNAVGSPQLPTEVSLYQEAGGVNVSKTLSSLLDKIKSSIASRNYFKSLSLLSVHGILLNSKFFPNQYSYSERLESRKFIVQTLLNLLNEHNYILPGIAAIFADALSLACRVSSEMSPDSCLSARQIIDRLSLSILSKLQLGDSIVSLSDFIMDSGSVLSSLVSFYSEFTKNTTRRAGPFTADVNGIIESINNFAVLGAQGNSFLPGTLPKIEMHPNFVTKLFAVETSVFAAYHATIESFRINRTSVAEIFLPRAVLSLNGQFFAVQLTMLFDNPFPYNLKCLDYDRTLQFETPKVYVPADNAGSVVLSAPRKPVIIFGLRTCALLGNVLLANIRIGQSAQLWQLQSDMRMVVMLPFDPTKSTTAVASNMADGSTGQTIGVSCVRWDPMFGMWTGVGIRRLSIFLGNSSFGPYVKCEVDRTGIYAVSEVPVGCDGIPLSPAVYDECGVCGGKNEVCSGCDGLPNSGRSKSCSGHGTCSGQICRCDPGFSGVICQIMCDPIKNCSGHGVCDVTYVNLEMITKVSCLCQAGFISSKGNNRSTLKVGCEPEIISNELIPQWAIIAMSVVVSLLVLCAASTFVVRMVYKQQQSFKAMRKDVTVVDSLWADGLLSCAPAIEIDADLAYPLYPSIQNGSMPVHHDQGRKSKADDDIAMAPAIEHGFLANQGSESDFNDSNSTSDIPESIFKQQDALSPTPERYTMVVGSHSNQQQLYHPQIDQGTDEFESSRPNLPLLNNELRCTAEDSEEGNGGMQGVDWRLVLVQNRIHAQNKAKLRSAAGPL